MASDHGGWPPQGSLAFKIWSSIVCLVLFSCILMWSQKLTSMHQGVLELPAAKLASPPPPKAVNDGSSLFLTSRSENHGCCPISGLPWDARIGKENATDRPMKMAFIIGAQKSGKAPLTLGS